MALMIAFFSAPVAALAEGGTVSDTKIPKGVRDGARKKLGAVKVATLYERVTDGILIGRSMEDVAKIFSETNTDLIFRGFFRWQPVPESQDSKLPGYPENYTKSKMRIGYSYGQYKEAISLIKKARPDVVFVGAIAAQRLNEIEYDDVTLEAFAQTQTWQMALDPAKLGIGISKEEGQRKAAAIVGTKAYFPDITNKKYQELLLSRAKKQIDLGVDAIWIDMLFGGANLIQKATKNPDHPAIKEFCDSASKIVDEIHAYGYSKYRKYIYVGTWWNFAQLPFPAPDVDFVTATPSAEEIQGGLDGQRWDDIKGKIKEKTGDLPVLAFIDWGGPGNTPILAFSQTLNPAQQREFLVNADDFFTKKGIVFVFPVHGGTFGENAKRLSYDRYPVYDSLAPEFNTYETIRKLAQKKK